MRTKAGPALGEHSVHGDSFDWQVSPERCRSSEEGHLSADPGRGFSEGFPGKAHLGWVLKHGKEFAFREDMEAAAPPPELTVGSQKAGDTSDSLRGSP